MAQIKTQKEFEVANQRINELLPLTWGDDVPADSPENIELALLTDLVAEYEDEHVVIPKPSLIDVIKLRMYEMGLTQKKIAEMLSISTSRISEILHGKAEPTLQTARLMCQKLDISPEIVLGL